MSSATDQLPEIDSLWNYNEPAETETRFRELLGRASADADYRAQLLTQIARTYSLRQMFDEAHATLEEAEALLPQAGPAAAVRAALERGRAFNSAGRKEDALRHFSDALERARDAGLDFYAVDAAHMLAIASTGEEALRWNERARELAEASSDPRAKRWLGALYNNIGWTYHDSGKFEAALESFERCLEWHREMKTVDGFRIARWTVGRALRSLGRIDEALERQRQLLADMTASETKPDGYVFEEIGECLLALGRTDEAAPNFARAHELLENDVWLKRDEPARLERMKALGSPA